MTKLATFVAVAALTIVTLSLPARAEWGRTYLSNGPPSVQPLSSATSTNATPTDATTVNLNASGSWWLCPSVGFDVFQIDLKTRAYNTGIIPGIGYGLKYKPANWTATAAVLAVDLFVQAALVDDSSTTPGAKYFSIEALPIVTMLDWVSIGFGLDEYVGVSSLPSELHWIFSFGMKKST
jgi:hypothetical protein